jgi:ribose transport system ATP-binding protein
VPATTSAPERTTPVVSARGLTKSFAGRRVLHGVDLDVLPGQVHGLVGQNGSGKSTLIKILAGYHAPDTGGALAVRGTDVSLPLAPSQPRALGISFVHQDLGLVDTGTVLENLRVGRYETGLGWRIPWADERRRAQAALARIDARISLDATVGALRDVDRAMVAIARALDEVEHAGGGLLVLDEPTAYLPHDATERLFSAVRAVAAAGVGVLFVTHRLEEILATTDVVTVLRNGELVATRETASVTQDDLVEQILGFSLERLYPESHEARAERVLSLRNASGGSVRDVTVDLHAGEILGVTGLAGMGHEQLPYLVFGAEAASSGELEIAGTVHDLRSFSPRAAIAAGLALLPGNRLRDGGVGAASLIENLTLPSLGRYFRGGRLRAGAQADDVAELARRFEVLPPVPTAALADFSGGNQQKALLAKWFHTEPRVMILHEPTQGVDIGAKRQIFQLIRDAAEAGTSFLLASAEHEDLAHLCDRVLVFRDGRVASSLHGAALTHERLLEQCFLDSVTPGDAPTQTPPKETM